MRTYRAKKRRGFCMKKEVVNMDVMDDVNMDVNNVNANNPTR